MNIEMFREIEREYSTEHAIAAFQMRSVAATIKLDKYNLFDKESVNQYKKLLNKKISLAFKGYNPRFVQECVTIYFAMYDWEICNTFSGFGGCEKKTFSELVKNGYND